MANTNTEIEKIEPKKKGRAVAVIVILLLLLTGGFLLWSHYRQPATNQLEESVRAQLGQLEGKSEAEIQAELDRVVDDASMAISINVNPAFKDGTAEGNLEIENSPANKYAQVVTITRDDTGEKIYDSGLIEPNYHVQKDKLLVDLDAGEYTCTATFTAYDDNQSPVGSAASKITVTVLS